MGKSAVATEFTLEGRFLGYEIEDGYKMKRLWLATAEGECCIKLTKEARVSLGRVLAPGEWVQVRGSRKQKEGETKLKAYWIQRSAPHPTTTPEPTPPAPPAAASTPQSGPTKACILVCQKPGCMKRGGKAVCQKLEQELGDRGLQDQVSIKFTGCMKQCKAAPNLVVMPGKTRYSKLNPEEVPDLIDRHFQA